MHSFFFFFLPRDAGKCYKTHKTYSLIQNAINCNQNFCACVWSSRSMTGTVLWVLWACGDSQLYFSIFLGTIYGSLCESRTSRLFYFRTFYYFCPDRIRLRAVIAQKFFQLGEWITKSGSICHKGDGGAWGQTSDGCHFSNRNKPWA